MDPDHDNTPPSEVLRLLGIAQAGAPLLDQPCIRFGLPGEAAHAGEVIQQLRAIADQADKVVADDAGLALAAPQIGIARTAAIVRPPNGTEVLLVNPRIVEESAEETAQYERCLSFFDVRGLVRRPKFIVVEHQGFDGGSLTSRFHFATARLVLHAIDHLHGVLYTARMLPGTDPVALHDIPNNDHPAPGSS